MTCLFNVLYPLYFSSVKLEIQSLTQFVETFVQRGWEIEIGIERG